MGALASFLDARANRGLWLLRIEDIDPPREVAGAASEIINCLIAHGLQWDGDILYQSQRHAAYTTALDKLINTQRAFFCDCSRRDIQESGGIYPGTCRQRHIPPTGDCAVRFRVNKTTVQFTDRLQGNIEQSLADDVGDFVIRRRDGLYAYQLAVVVDDAFQNITDVVRGSDLLDSTARQIALQETLGLPTPCYLHFPVITNVDGEKLSKQTFAPAIDAQSAGNNLRYALRFLCQVEPPAELMQPQHIVDWATKHWRPNLIPARSSITATT